MNDEKCALKMVNDIISNFVGRHVQIETISGDDYAGTLVFVKRLHLLTLVNLKLSDS